MSNNSVHLNAGDVVSLTDGITGVSADTTHPEGISYGAFFWDYSGIGILGIDGICILLGAIPFKE